MTLDPWKGLLPLKLCEKLVVARHAHNRTRLDVEAWLKSEGEKGNLRIASDSPVWSAYEAALTVWHEAIEALDEWIRQNL